MSVNHRVLEGRKVQDISLDRPEIRVRTVRFSAERTQSKIVVDSDLVVLNQAPDKGRTNKTSATSNKNLLTF